jgi:tetratricopeptide (TPR) repeat protein
MLHAGDKDAAMENIQQTITLRPESTVGYILRSKLHADDKEYEDAHADLQHALSLRPGHLGILAEQASLYSTQEDYAQALAISDQFLVRQPEDASILVLQAYIHLMEEERELAWERLHEALTLDPDDPYTLLLRALLYSEAGEYDLAQLDLHRVLDQFPELGYAHAVQALVYQGQEAYDDMVQSAELALTVDPATTEAYRPLWVGAVLEEDVEQALEQAQSWVEAAPGESEAYYFLGSAHNMLGNGQEAVDSFSEALSLAEEDNPFVADIYLQRAAAYLNQDESELAKADLESILPESTRLDAIDQAEMTLANPSVQARTMAGRRVIEDTSIGYTISYDEAWVPWPVEPDEGFVLSLGQGEDDPDASVELWVFNDWDPSVSLYELADWISPTDWGGIVVGQEPIQMAGQEGLLQRYEVDDFGSVVVGGQYFVAKGNMVAILDLWASEETYADFEAEFEAMVDSFAFLE